MSEDRNGQQTAHRSTGVIGMVQEKFYEWVSPTKKQQSKPKKIQEAVGKDKAPPAPPTMTTATVHGKAQQPPRRWETNGVSKDTEHKPEGDSDENTTQYKPEGDSDENTTQYKLEGDSDKNTTQGRKQNAISTSESHNAGGSEKAVQSKRTRHSIYDAQGTGNHSHFSIGNGNKGRINGTSERQIREDPGRAVRPLDQDWNDLEKRYKDMSQQNQRLTDDCRKSQDCIKRLEDENRKSKDQIKRLEDENRKSKDQIKRLEDENRKSKGQIKRFEDEIRVIHLEKDGASRELTYENKRLQEQHLKDVEILAAEKTTMYGKLMEMEKQLHTELSLRPRSGDGGSNSGLHAMDGVNPVTFNQSWLKLYQTLRKLVDNMITQNSLQTDTIRSFYEDFVGGIVSMNNASGVARFNKPIQKRLIEHIIISKLTTIWDTAILGDVFEFVPAETIFPELEQTFAVLQSLRPNSSKESEIKVLVTRTKSEFARLLIDKLPKPGIEMTLSDGPFHSCNLPSDIADKLYDFWILRCRTVMDVLNRLGDQEAWTSSIFSLVYTCIHIRLQMEIMEGEGLAIIFAGTALDRISILGEDTGSGVVSLRSDWHNATQSVNRSKKGEEHQEDRSVLLTVFPGVASLKTNGDWSNCDRSNINFQSENQCTVLSY
ncbi:hypothetical protein BC938DRAFT_477811 [Jimgerdemannia flammicorona]|uniref:Uncharacterized protein n=1 Tax=Jimgerdemannia flammicorona TaxID=994334 RepID=A0A433QYU8_9FUNG|nr:hypothetical protein BC938DRAFT_477811 [Jimgerdemannia flammicorona]